MIDPVNKAQLAIAAAEERDPGNAWVAKMKDYYHQNGYLSDKQIASLDRVMPSLEFLKLKAKIAFEKGNITRQEYGLLLTAENIEVFGRFFSEIEKRIADSVPQISYSVITEDNIDQFFPQSSYVVELLEQTSPYDITSRRNPKKTLGVNLDIARGLIRPTMLDLCDLEMWEEQEHEAQEDWNETNIPGYEREPYESFLDQEFYH